MPILQVTYEDKCSQEGCDADATIAGVNRRDWRVVKAGCPDHWKQMGVKDGDWVIVGMSLASETQQTLIASERLSRGCER